MDFITLRIGNYLYAENGTLFRVTSLVEKAEQIRCLEVNRSDVDEKSIKLTTIKGVPITKEWLDRSNLNLTTKRKDYMIFRFGKSDFGLTFDYDRENNFHVTFEGNELIPIRFIHELQNFYGIFMNKNLRLKIQEQVI